MAVSSAGGCSFGAQGPNTSENSTNKPNERSNFFRHSSFPTDQLFSLFEVNF